MKWLNNKGSATIWAVTICLSIILVMCAVSEYMRITIITAGIRDAIQSAIISVVTANYDDAYSQLREGYSGGYLYNISGFTESIDMGDVYNRVDQLLGLVEEGEQHVKYTVSKQKEYVLSDVQLTFENTELAPGNTNKNLNAVVRVYVEIPVQYGGREILPLKLSMQVRASYTPKF